MSRRLWQAEQPWQTERKPKITASGFNIAIPSYDGPFHTRDEIIHSVSKSGDSKSESIESSAVLRHGMDDAERQVLAASSWIPALETRETKDGSSTLESKTIDLATIQVGDVVDVKAIHCWHPAMVVRLEKGKYIRFAVFAFSACVPLDRIHVAKFGTRSMRFAYGVDVKDPILNLWYRGRIVKAGHNRVLVQPEDPDNRAVYVDEWISADSLLLAKQGTHTQTLVTIMDACQPSSPIDLPLPMFEIKCPYRSRMQRTPDYEFIHDRDCLPPSRVDTPIIDDAWIHFHPSDTACSVTHTWKWDSKSETFTESPACVPYRIGQNLNRFLMQQKQQQYQQAESKGDSKDKQVAKLMRNAFWGCAKAKEQDKKRNSEPIEDALFAIEDDEDDHLMIGTLWPEKEEEEKSICISKNRRKKKEKRLRELQYIQDLKAKLAVTKQSRIEFKQRYENIVVSLRRESEQVQVLRDRLEKTALEQADSMLRSIRESKEMDTLQQLLRRRNDYTLELKRLNVEEQCKSAMLLRENRQLLEKLKNHDDDDQVLKKALSDKQQAIAELAFTQIELRNCQEDCSSFETKLHRLENKILESKGQQQVVVHLKDEDKDDEGQARYKPCVVCMDHRPEHMFYNCSHFCVCAECAKQLDKCPICRTEGPTVQVFTLDN